MTFLAALRHDRLEAPWLVDGPINGACFRGYVDKVLVPTLQPGDLVIMDNLGSHKAKAVRRAIRAVGAQLFFLPKYSHDLNPIEPLFATLKHWLRKAAKRTTDAIGHILATLTSAECTSYFSEGDFGFGGGSFASSAALNRSELSSAENTWGAGSASWATLTTRKAVRPKYDCIPCSIFVVTIDQAGDRIGSESLCCTWRSCRGVFGR
jgi:transposase